MSVRIKHYSNLGIEDTEQTDQRTDQQVIIDKEGYSFNVGLNDSINFLDDARGDSAAASAQTNQNIVKDKIPYGSERA